jgi:hypothetical protein
MFPEFRLPLPETDVTVCATVSVLFHVTVLLTPMITVIVSGEYPGAPCGPAPEPLGIVTRMLLVLDEPLLLEAAALDVDTEEELPAEDVELLATMAGWVAA